MEKKSNSKTKDPKPSASNQRIFGANQLQINGDDASRLIGSIIEKGISENQQNKPLDPTRPPQPTVLPFPLARHRFHGPHWDPVSSKKDVIDDDDDDDEEEDNDSTDFDPISAFANPVKRKEKKGLNLSQWRELVQSDNLLGTDKRGENRLHVKKTAQHMVGGATVDNANKKDVSCLNEVPMEVDVEPALRSSLSPIKMGEAMSSVMVSGSLTSPPDMEIDNFQVHENVREANFGLFNGEAGSIESVLSNGIAKAQVMEVDDMDLGQIGMPNNREQKTSTIFSSSSLNNFEKEQGSMSLESEIDAENLARIQNMSSEEIAEAQSEIMEKISPALLNILKKRGQEKLKKQNLSRSDVAIKDQMANPLRENQSITESNISPHVGSDSYQVITTKTTKDANNVLDSGVVQNLGPCSGKLWNAWSERVEAVRGLRFSLEGTVITDESETGNILMNNRDSVDTVAERDFLRTEGDPGAAGYTIKEAVQLTRSVIPGQRALALHLLASVLDKAMQNILHNQVGSTMRNTAQVDDLIDWEAIWAYALGPDPELVLSLRICLDDNHSSVVLACAKVILCALSCDSNENFFEIWEKIATCEKDMFTAPVFRSRPEIHDGFLHGGFWKYNAKPSNIVNFAEDIIDEETEGKHTIQDDIVVAGQDFAAGLVRMGILSRMRYLLEADPTAVLEERIMSILIAVARHSPTCANAVMNCERLVHVVVHRCTMDNSIEIRPSMIKSVSLLRVLAQSNRKNCVEFVKNESFQVITQHLFRYTSSLDYWIRSGKEICKLSSALVVEQLRFWKVCIHYGCCISYFPDIFPALCLWLNPPTFSKLQENNVLDEFASISREAFHVLEALGRKLPDFYSQKHLTNQISDCSADDPEAWSWSYATPVVDLALKWIVSLSDPFISELVEGQKGIMSDLVFHDSCVGSLLWVYSAVMHMLSTLFEKLNLEDTMTIQGNGRDVLWLPEFVPKVGLEIIKNGILSLLGANGTEHGNWIAGDKSFIEQLCHLRQHSKYETSLASVSCLRGLLRVIISIDALIHLAKSGIHSPLSQGDNFSREGKILKDGMVNSSMFELRCVLNVFIKLVASERQFVPSVEIFGRGGLAPGVGLGWGSSGGGFWSLTVLLAQKDAGLLIDILKIFQMDSRTELQADEEMAFTMHRINSVLEVCLTVGPRDGAIVENALDILLQVPVLNYLNFCIQHFLQSNRRKKPFGWEYKEEDYVLFGKILASHFKDRWLSLKRKSKTTDKKNSSGHRTSKEGRVSLDTIHEDLDTSNMINQDHYYNSLTAEWAHQRLPLPTHWFLSPITTISGDKHSGLQNSFNTKNIMKESLDVAKGGLFILLGLEVMSTFLPSDVLSPIQSVPLFWKLHSLSVILFAGMGVLEDDKSRDIYEALQDLYGRLVDEIRYIKSGERIFEENVNLLPETGKKSNVEFLRFQSEIHESYATFLETLVEQFAAISYGDLIFGRQVALYLHLSTEAPVRLAAWNALANARVLEILPPLEKCIAQAEGYLEPIEDNEGLLEAYAKSWVSGALDRAATRRSMAYTLVLHHLSSFIFLIHANDKLSLQNKLVKSLLRDYSQKESHEGMMIDFVEYYQPFTSYLPEGQEVLTPQSITIEKKFEVLVEACDRNSSLLTVVEKLRSALLKKRSIVN